MDFEELIEEMNDLSDRASSGEVQTLADAIRSLALHLRTEQTYREEQKERS